MIIFDLDGTLADCEHRRHLVDRYHPINEKRRLSEISLERSPHPEPNPYIWRPDWPAFYEACDKDLPITPVIHMLEYIGEGKEYGSDTPLVDYDGVEIWSARCESVRKKTEKWLSIHLRYYSPDKIKLKMRPVRDYTPDDQLKEKWLDEAIAEGKTIDFIFDDRPKVIEMWRRRGIFVFNCCQHSERF
jgi:hypothetical protein